MKNWDADDWWAWRDERAGFLEFCQGLSREEAERIACREEDELREKAS